MAIRALGTERPVGTAYEPKLPDAQILEQAIRLSIFTSPRAFLKTIEDVDNSDPDYWEKEISSATWVVIQRDKEVVGVAVARWPDLDTRWNVDQASARYIESVWIDPELRGSHLAERLVRFLFEVEYAKSPDVRQFLLWVFRKNKPAIRLYRRMGFKYVGKQALPDGSGRIELRYKYSFKPDAAKREAAAVARQQDLEKHGVIYRVLGDGETSYSSPR
jgi:ribosomal protein S18 acetylase RimI-like enzyme